MLSVEIVLAGASLAILVLVLLARIRTPKRFAVARRAGAGRFDSADRPLDAQVRHLDAMLTQVERQVQEQVNPRLAALDRMILDADREIVRLQGELANSGMSRSRTVSAAPDAIVSEFVEAGADRQSRRAA